MSDFLRAKNRVLGLVQFLAVFFFMASLSNAFALDSVPPENDEKNGNSYKITNEFSDSSGIDYDINKLLKWREQIQRMINESKISDVGETIMDSLEECLASINIRLGILELGERHIRD